MQELEERFANALHSAARAWRQVVDRRLKCLGLSHASWTTIAVAAKARSPLSQSELAERIGVEGATMVAMVDRLITRMKTLPGVWFPSCEEVARWCLEKFPPRARAT